MNKIVSVIFVIFLIIGVPLLLAFLLDIKQTKIQAILATYVVVVGSFLVYFYLQNQSKTALRKKLYELEKKERAEAEAFIVRNRRELYNDMQTAKREAEGAKYKGLSRPEIMKRKAAEDVANLEKLGIKSVYSSSMPRRV